MHLSKINISGFKSFADQVSIVFKNNLVGIVGPNGCGKSNIIDAIRWVLGVGTAKSLRGNSMDDVIFKGSDTRAPADRAVVELLFDNSDGFVKGEFAKYDELSVRRELNIEGDSHYFLNNTRCRKKDVTDIFLGTGLSKKGYAIIQQGMVSRIVESNPQEIKSFLEDSAGIARFKERKRESELKIAHTKRNLDRVTDLRKELKTQLNKLDRQSRHAERYKKYQQKRRELKLSVLFSHYISSKEKYQKSHLEIQDITKVIQNLDNNQKNLESQLSVLDKEYKQAFSEKQDLLNEENKLDLQIGQLKQSYDYLLLQKRDNHEQLNTIVNNHNQLCLQAKKKKDELQTIAEQQNAKDKGRNDIFMQYEKAKEIFDRESRVISDFESLAVSLESDAKNLSYEQKLLDEKISDMEADFMSNKSKYQNIQTEYEKLKSIIKDSELEKLSSELKLKQELLFATEQKNQKNSEQHHLALAQRDAIYNSLNQLNEVKQKLIGEIATLSALSIEGNQEEKSRVYEWLTKTGLSERHSLAHYIEASEPYSHAVEMLLSEKLGSIVVGELEQLMKPLSELKSGKISFISIDQQNEYGLEGTLAQYVKAPRQIARLLEKVKIMDGLGQAFEAFSGLNPDELIFSKDGYLLSNTQLVYYQPTSAQKTQLTKAKIYDHKQQELKKCQEQINAKQNETTLLNQSIEEANSSKADLENSLSQIREALNNLNDNRNNIYSQIQSHNAQLHIQLNTMRNLENSNDKINLLLNKNKQSRDSVVTKLDSCKNKIDDLEKKKNDLMSGYNQAKLNYEEIAKEKTEYDAKQKNLDTLVSSHKNHLEFINKQLATTLKQKEKISKALEESEAQLPEKKEKISSKIALKEDLEKRIAIKSQALEQIHSKLEHANKELAEIIRSIGEQNQTQHQAQLLLKEYQLAIIQHEKDITELKGSIDDIHTYSLIDNLGEVEVEIESLDNSITQLGAINLTAIEEYNELKERHEFLENQYNDITNSIDILEKSIAEIDKQTESAFHSVFESIQKNLNEVVNYLFAGGKATLEIVGDKSHNSQGVEINVQPPGKKISSIQSLSGGEKTMTAIAFVVAMFRLNPAPFCLMDEVDAALDDVNIRRFCALLTEMSDTVQHIVISHHKQTMSIAKQLNGVTMNEAGVSKVVSVDMKRAS